MKENLNDYLDQIDYEEVKKDFLTVDEVKKLAATDCRLPGLKRASLFSILTGLCLSDILNLKWEDIRQDADGEISMFIRIQKTKKETCHPLSAEMLALCGERKTGKVFKDFQRHMAQRPLQEWLKQPGLLNISLSTNSGIPSPLSSSPPVLTFLRSANYLIMRMSLQRRYMFNFCRQQNELRQTESR